MATETIKIAILGSPNVGKFSLAASFLNLDMDKTKQVIIDEKFESRFTLQNGTVIKLILYIINDGGNKKSSINNAMKMTDGAILLFDITNRETFKVVENYIEALDRNSPKFVKFNISIFGNKCDDEANRQVKDEEALEFAHKNGVEYGPISALKKINIPEAINALVEATHAKKHAN